MRRAARSSAFYDAFVARDAHQNRRVIGAVHAARHYAIYSNRSVQCYGKWVWSVGRSVGRLGRRRRGCRACLFTTRGFDWRGRPELINLLARPDKCLLAISIELKSVNVSSAEKNNALVPGDKRRHFQLTDTPINDVEHEQRDGNLMYVRYVHRCLTLTVYNKHIIYARVVCTMLKPVYWSTSAGWRLLIIF